MLCPCNHDSSTYPVFLIVHYDFLQCNNFPCAFPLPLVYLTKKLASAYVQFRLGQAHYPKVPSPSFLISSYSLMFEQPWYVRRKGSTAEWGVGSVMVARTT